MCSDRLPAVRVCGLLALSFVLHSGAAWAQTVRPSPVTGQRPVSAAEPVIYVAAGFYLRGSSATFGNNEVFSTHAEQARFGATYAVPSGPLVDLSAAVAVSRVLAVGVGFNRTEGSASAEIVGDIPHPFFFDRGRALAGTAADLNRTERTINAQLRAMFDVARTRVTIFGGPSFVHVRQAVITAIDYTESYPYDSVELGNVRVTAGEGSTVGFHVGGDVAYYFDRRVGVGFGGQVVTGEAPLSIPGADVRTHVGGFQFGGGLRLRF